MMTVEKPRAAKRVQMELRMSHEEKARIVKAAAMMGQSVNAYATSWLISQADEILLNASVPAPKLEMERK